MQLEDFSNLKPVGDIEIPLNGLVYYADPNPPSETVLAATGAHLADSDVDAIQQVMSQGEQGVTQQVLGIAVKASHAATLRALQFLQDVLRPESAERWAANMKVQRDAAGTVVENPAAITLAQCMAVYRALVKVYAEGRPTEPSSPSPNGHDGTGTTSMAGQPVGE